MEITNKILRKTIENLGGYVSVVDSTMPTTMIFTKCTTPIVHNVNGKEKIDEDLDNYYQKRCLELGICNINNIEEFKIIINQIIDIDINTIFKLYHVHKNTDDTYNICFGHISNFFGRQVEVGIEEAKQLINDPIFSQKNWYYVKNLKDVYNL